MKTKKVLLSGLMALGLAAVSCSKQNVEPNQNAVGRAGNNSTERFGGVNVGQLLVGSGNIFELPYFFPNSEGVSMIGTKIRIDNSTLANNIYDVTITNKAKLNGQPDFATAVDGSGCGAQTITGVAFDASGIGTVDLVTAMDFTQLQSTCGFSTTLSKINVAVYLKYVALGSTGTPGNKSNLYVNAQYSPEFLTNVITNTSTGDYAAGIIADGSNDFTFSFTDDVKTLTFTADAALTVGNLGSPYKYAVNYIVTSGSDISSMMPTNMEVNDAGLTPAALTSGFSVDFPIDGISGVADEILVSSFWYDPLWISGVATNATISVADFTLTAN